MKKAIKVSRPLKSILLIFFCLNQISSFAQATKRVALIVSNENYKEGAKLSNVHVSCDSLEQVLKMYGFKTIRLTDVGKEKLEKGILSFATELKKNDVGILYFGGHVCYSNGDLFLLPIDINLSENQPFNESSCTNLSSINEIRGFKSKIKDEQERIAKVVLESYNAKLNQYELARKKAAEIIAGKEIPSKFIILDKGITDFYNIGREYSANSRREILEENIDPGSTILVHESYLLTSEKGLYVTRKSFISTLISQIPNKAEFTLMLKNQFEGQFVSKLHRPFFFDNYQPLEAVHDTSVYLKFHDKDSDGILNIVDRCPDETGEITSEGCPEKPMVWDDFEGYIFVKGGSYMMGSDSSNIDNQKPEHKVTLSNFWIKSTEVTQSEWLRFTHKAYIPNYGCIGCSLVEGVFESDCRDCPITEITYQQILDYIDFLNTFRTDGKKYRLPTEAEWEYAAIGGSSSKGFIYSGSQNLSDVAVLDKISKVATKQPNELGLYDISGNVSEICSDWLDFYSPEDQVDPKGPTKLSTWIVIRGGGVGDRKENYEVKYRSLAAKGLMQKSIGFRLVLQ